MTVNVTLELPDDMAAQARSAGLLDPNVLRGLLQRELGSREEARKRFAEHLRRVEEIGGEPMSMEEINAEIHAMRAEKRARNAGNA